MYKYYKTTTILLLLLVMTTTLSRAQRPMEKLDRSVVAHKLAQGMYINWRINADEYRDTSYRLYRDGTLIHETGPDGASNFVDQSGNVNSVYTVSKFKNGKESTPSKPAIVTTNGYIDIPLRDLKSLGKTGYFPNDATAADLDGDGAMEIIVKRLNTDWSVGNTNYTFFEAYKLDGTFLWAIDVGPNICNDVEINIAAFDFDGDGKAEVFLRTSEGTVFGDGKKIGDTDNDGITNYRNTASPQGYMNHGPEFLSLVCGETGAEIDRVDFIPRGQSSDWGDNYGHRANKFFFGAPYLDGLKPSLFIGRGIYTKTEMRTYDIVNKKLVLRWEFKSGNSGPYYGQGNHNFTISDVDGDGKDEITWGQMCVNHDGKGLYSTQMGHGDAMHVGDFDPYRKGKEVFSCLENSPVYGTLFRDAATGEILHHYVLGRDCGRCCAGNISDNFKGAELWGAGFGYSATNLVPMQHFGLAENYTIYWDGGLTKEILDHTGFSTSTGVGYGHITKFNGYGNVTTMLRSDAYSCNYTKGTPNLQADILGDWREEAIWWRSDSMALRIHTTTHPTTHRIYTLLHDHQYRQAICWQMCGYNQPPHPSFYLGSDFPEPIAPKTTNGKLVWKGSNSNWNFSSENWMDGDDAIGLIAGTSAVIPYVDGKRVLLDPRGIQRTIQLDTQLKPEGLTASGTAEYTLSGSGELAGDMWLDKMGEGMLIINGNHSFSGLTDIWEGALIVNDTLFNSPVKIRRHAELQASGKLGNGLNTEYNAQLYPGGKNEFGNLTIKGTFSWVEGARVVFDIPKTVEEQCDFLLVNNVLSVQNGAVLQLNLLAGDVEAGTYSLIKATHLIGDVSKIKVTGATGVAVELQYDDVEKVINLVVKGVRSASRVEWTGAESAIWDLASSVNWKQHDQADIFVGNDTVVFNEKASRRSVIIAETLNPLHMVVNSTLPYVFDGSGSLTGKMSLLKSNSSSLTLNNRNDFTGGVTHEGGLLLLKYAPTATNTGGIGPNDADPSKLVLRDSAIIQVNTANEMTDRGITFSGSKGGVMNVPVTLFWNGPMIGTKMTKMGTGLLNIGHNNSNLLETVLRSGTLKLNTTGSVPYGPGRKLTMLGGTLETVNLTGAYLTSSHHIEVPQGATATFIAGARCEYNGSLTGSGTLNWVADFIRTYINGDWSNFSGRLNITTNRANSTYQDKFIVNNSKGFPNAIVNLGSGDLILCYKNGTADNGTTTIRMGMLTGVAGSIVHNAGVEVGSLNTSGAFAGTFTGIANLRKTGSGMWLLSGINTNTGTTTVSDGTLAVSGALGSGTITVQNGATLTLTGTAAGSAVVSVGGTMVLSGTLSGNLNSSGLVRGTGTVGNASLLSNGSVLQPGSSIVGKMTFNGNLTIRNGALLDMQLLGGSNSADQLVVNGVLTTGGILELSSYHGVFAEGAEYQLFNATAITGQFDEVRLPRLPAELDWDQSELYTRGVLKVIVGVNNVQLPTFESQLINNPSDGEFLLRTESAGIKLKFQLTDLNGRILLAGDVTADNEDLFKIDLRAYASGVYVLNVMSDAGSSAVHRLIKL